MNLDDHDIELIEKSISGSLNETERKEFEEKINSSQPFKENVAFQRSLLSSLDANHKVKLKEELTQMLHDVGSNKKPASSFFKKWHIVAASVLVLLGSVWIFRLPDNTNHSLYEAYYEPYQNILISRSTDSKLMWTQSYSENKFEDVIDILQKNTNKSDTVNFYLAISYMSTEKYPDAISYFSKINENSNFYQQKIWYLALSYVAVSNHLEAKDLLEQMESFRFKKDEARELLELLN